MKSRNPFSFISVDWLGRLFLVLLFFSAGLMFVFSITGASLNTGVAPYGIVSLELAGSAEKTENILNSWGVDGQLRAAFGLGLDFLFIPIYALTIGVGCLISEAVLVERKWPLGTAGPILAWGLIAAGIFDVIENILLILTLFQGVNQLWSQLATGFAVMKFLLIFLGIVYLFYGGAISLVTRLSKVS